jgi:hypothetical protein
VLRLLHETLAEAHGLALASTRATEAVAARVDNRSLRSRLRRMRRESEEIRLRCLRFQETLSAGIRDDMRVHVIAVDAKAADVAHAWLDAGSDPLRVWLLLAMGESAELAVWRAVAALAARSAEGSHVADLAEWALEIQERHLGIALAGSSDLASSLARAEALAARADRATRSHR